MRRLPGPLLAVAGLCVVLPVKAKFRCAEPPAGMSPSAVGLSSADPMSFIKWGGDAADCPGKAETMSSQMTCTADGYVQLVVPPLAAIVVPDLCDKFNSKSLGLFASYVPSEISSIASLKCVNGGTYAYTIVIAAPAAECSDVLSDLTGPDLLPSAAPTPPPPPTAPATARPTTAPTVPAWDDSGLRCVHPEQLGVEVNDVPPALEDVYIIEVRDKAVCSALKGYRKELDCTGPAGLRFVGFGGGPEGGRGLLKMEYLDLFNYIHAGGNMLEVLLGSDATVSRYGNVYFNAAKDPKQQYVVFAKATSETDASIRALHEAMEALDLGLGLKDAFNVVARVDPSGDPDQSRKDCETVLRLFNRLTGLSLKVERDWDEAPPTHGRINCDAVDANDCELKDLTEPGQLRAGDTVRLDPPRVGNRTVIFYRNNVTVESDQIKYTYESNLPATAAGINPIGLDTDSGALTVALTRPGSFQIALYATEPVARGAELKTKCKDFEASKLSDEAAVDVFLWRWEFDVAEADVFGTSAAWRARATEVEKIPTELTTGATYTIPGPSMATEELFVHPDADDFSRISFLVRMEPLTRGAPATPGNFLTDTKTGKILLDPAAAGTVPYEYSATLEARDGGDGVATVRTWNFSVVSPVASPAFAMVGASCSRGIEPGPGKGGPVPPAPTSMYVDETETIDGPNVAKDALFENAAAGAYDKIAYKLKFGEAGSPGQLLVDTNNGQILARPTKAGDFEANLVAVDAAGSEACVRAWRFTVQSRPEFKVADDWAAKHLDVSVLNRSKHVVNQPFTLPAPDRSRQALFENFAEEDETSITYSIQLLDASGGLLECPGSGCPGKFFVDQTGEVLAQPTKVDAFDAVLIAKDVAGSEAQVTRWQFSVLERDVDLAVYGPNGRDCKHGEQVDEVELDQAFVCDCNGTFFRGPNCEQPIPTSASSVVGESSSDNTSSILGGVLGSVVLVLLLVAFTYWWKATAARRRAHNFHGELQRMLAAEELDPSLANDLAVPREIRRSCVKLIESVGQGEFGEVWKASLDESKLGGVPAYTVAVKMINNPMAPEEEVQGLLSEATLMAQVTGHEHVLSIIGAVTRGWPLMLVVAYCEHGSLLSILRKRAAARDPVSAGSKLRFSQHISEGMAFLASKHIVHRDLATRNCLVDSQFSAQVADFGLSRGTKHAGESSYYRSRNGVFPIRWTAPEAMSELKFTSAADVWSFGIVVVELFQDGQQPYAAIPNHEVLVKVQSGYRVPRDELGCSEQVYATLLRCWADEPRDRPGFDELSAFFAGAEASATEQAARAPPPALAASGADPFLPRAESAEGFGGSTEKWADRTGGSAAPAAAVENTYAPESAFEGRFDLSRTDGATQYGISRSVAGAAAETEFPLGGSAFQAMPDGVAGGDDASGSASRVPTDEYLVVAGGGGGGGGGDDASKGISM